MHELGLAEEIAGVALAEAEKHGAARVTTVAVRVGVLRGVVPDTLSFLFGHVTKGTIAEGATLSVEEEPVTVDCPECGPSGALEFTLSCPACGKPCGGIRGGDSLRILSVDLDIQPEGEGA